MNMMADFNLLEDDGSLQVHRKLLYETRIKSILQHPRTSDATDLLY